MTEERTAGQLRFGRRGGRNMGQPVEKPREARKTVLRLLKYFGQFRNTHILLLAAVIPVVFTALAAPAIQGAAIDEIAARNWEGLRRLVILLAIVFLVNVLCTLAQSLLAAKLSQSIVKLMRHDLFGKIDRLPIAYIDTHSSGDIMSRMANDVDNISSTISQSLGSLVSGVLTVLGTTAIMFYYCPQLTAITLLTVVLSVTASKNMSKVMRNAYRRRSETLGRLNGHSEEMITSYCSVAAYNKQKDIIEEFNRASDELASAGTRAEILGGSMGPLMNCIYNISFVIVAAFGGYFAAKGIITIGVISAFIIYARQFSRPINEIAQLYGSVQTAVAGAERVFELIDSPDEDNSGKSLMPEGGGIEFRNICFSYVKGKQVLHDFNLKIKQGEKVALVGATGSGKTTVVNLLMRFYPTDSGQIMIDGVDICDISRDELRRNTAIVLQDTVLFSDTIANNIKYSNTEATDEQMLQAAKLSNSSYFIEKLPQGYETYLSRAGTNLSQGQRQLLNIARAVLADPEILILDEATSSVDTRTEKNIQDAMVRLMKNRTSLIIAHRLSTIRDADRIVVMENGRIAETGNHDELIEKQGKYYELYMTQFSGKNI